MSTHTILRTVLMVWLLAVAGCKTANQTNNQVIIKDFKANELLRITNESSVTAFFVQWKKREKVFVKKMPTFEVELGILENKDLSRWKYSSKGYVTSIDKADNIVYRIMLPEIDKVIQTR